DLLPTPAARAANRHAQSVGVVVQLLHPVRLRTDVAARERVVLVSPHRPDGVTLDPDDEPARGLAERAHPVHRPASPRRACGLSLAVPCHGPRRTLDEWPYQRSSFRQFDGSTLA